MTAGESKDWLGAALTALEHIPLDILEKGCRRAKLACTHHGQIVPKIIELTRDEVIWRSRPKSEPVKFLPPPSAERLAEKDRPDPETLMPALRRMGLQKGWIVERGGRLVWA